MARGRHYYDPILQVPSRPEEGPKERIELYPEGDVTDAAPGPLRWVARLIDPEGRIVQYSPGSFDRDGAMRQAQEMWPGREIYELREESEDSTHEGFGPSLRLWQNIRPDPDPVPPVVDVHLPFPPPTAEQLTQGQRDAIMRAGESIVAGAATVLPPAPEDVTSADPNYVVPTELHAMQVPQPGTYVRLEDVLALLEEYAGQFDEGGNPSAALGLREAASALREAF